MLFPKICVSCAKPLNAKEDTICISCLINLPKTNYHRLSQNPVSERFKGRLRVHDATSFLYFAKGNSTRSLLHHLKYNGRQDIGRRLGALFAKDLMNDGYHPGDLIIPLPLHHAKHRIRGYNQCDSIAQGLSKYFGSKVRNDIVFRISNNSTQTKKGRFDRWKNVSGIFSVRGDEQIAEKHVILLDDVITTGSTLESCGQSILNAGAAKLSILTLATA